MTVNLRPPEDIHFNKPIGYIHGVEIINKGSGNTVSDIIATDVPPLVTVPWTTTSSGSYVTINDLYEAYSGLLSRDLNPDTILMASGTFNDIMNEGI